MSSPLDYLELCRLCLVKDRVQVPIFEDDGDVNQIFLKIHACLPVKVSRDDKLPRKICSDCSYKLELFYQFWNTTANAEKQLLQWLGEDDGLDDKQQGYVTEVLDPNVMKQEGNSDSRLDNSVMQVSGHQNMDINMIENMSIITMPAGSDQQFTTVPMGTRGTVQTVQVPGPSTQTAHDQTGVAHLQEVEVDQEDEDNMDDGCDNDDGLPVKEETDEGDRSLEQSYVSLPCDEAGPSGLQQQKISEMSEITIQQTADGDHKTGLGNSQQLVFAERLDEATIAVSQRTLASCRLTDVLSCGNQFHSVVPKPSPTQSFPARSNKPKSMLVYVCKQCNIYFPIRRMLELHDCKYGVRPLASSSARCPGTEPDDRVQVHEPPMKVDVDDENSWQVETLDENLSLLAKAKECKKPDGESFLSCPICSFNCDNPSICRSHVKRKHQIGWLQLRGKENLRESAGYKAKEDKVAMNHCPHCSFETPNKSTLYSHVSRSHSERRRAPAGEASLRGQNGYACSYCTFAAVTMSSLRCHNAREHGARAAGSRQPVIELPVLEFDCEQCDYKTKSRKCMQHHLKVTHQVKPNDEGMFICHLCSYETLSKMGLQRHISIKHERVRHREAKVKNEPYLCSEANCSYRTFNAKVLEWHVKQRHRRSPAADYYCDDCDFSTWTKALLLTHMKRNHTGAGLASGDIGPLQCDCCDYTTRNKHVMKVHVIRKHTEGFSHACELCGKKYKIKADLTNHVRFQHREQPIICDVCGKTCRNSNLLYLHQKFAHYKPEFECHICHRRMVSQANLDEHVFKQHEQRQDVICEQCGKTFTRQSRLKIHMRTHLGLRPHTCQICGKSFARRNGLRQHLLIHTGQRPYVCDICGKDFTQKTGLISHRKSHPGSHPPLPRITIDHVLSGLMSSANDAI
ncbi:zinc finger protein 84-like isoform X3 [Phymastichus coffea]|uniref:zinc finger protein 84-like isoform X3 n=1 Tax=Phymastichus coffea TaxID=108790 RepID=UPI00273CD110|nr:zinc finger protein 84-like isoform X3 [Phymastichus coffea]